MQKIFIFTLLFLLASCGGGNGDPASTDTSGGDSSGGDGAPTPAISRFVVASSLDDVGGITNAGSVMLIDGVTGAQIGTTISGDDGSDNLGFSSLTSLGNGNFVIASAFDDIGGVNNSGSVMIINGTTGAQIGTTISGDNANDQLGGTSVTSLGNGNFVIASANDDVGGLVNAGSVMIINGTTGVQIGVTISGDDAQDLLGGSSVTVLSNGNFVIASAGDDVGGVFNVGSVMLINGMTGAQIGATITGDSANDALGGTSVTALSNGNFVIASAFDDVGGVSDAGSVMLINGSTGAQIGATISGDNADDRLGRSSVTSLGNGNFVIASENDDVGGVSNAGSVMLINGTTGTQIGATISGDVSGDNLGASSVTSLGNGNFVIASAFVDVGGLFNAGSVMIINGTTGAQIGSTIFGDAANDLLGVSSVTSLGNGNFVIASAYDDFGGLADTGSVMIINGATGVQIGATISGDSASDSLGESSVTVLPNGNFVIASGGDEVGGLSAAGSVILVNGSTGAQVGATISGDDANDNLGFSSVTSLGNGNFVIASEFDDVGGVANAGSVMIINGTTGAQIGTTISGDSANDYLGSSGVTVID